MLGRILKAFNTKPEIVIEDPEHLLQSATCVLLLEIAGADDDFSPEECEHIVNTLCKRFTLTQQEAEELIEIASINRDQSSDIWKYTHTINERCTPEEKREIIKEVWRVIYADGTLDAHEDHLAHKLARLLNLTHPELIDAKVAVLEELRQA